MSRTALLAPAFAAELAALGRLLQTRARSGAGGDRTGRRRGGSAEFMEHRSYDGGDDVRRIDWLAFARSGQPLVKLFRQDEDVVVRLTLDASGSMAHGEPEKLETALRIAAALGYLALTASERAEVLVMGADGVERARPLRGRAGVARMLAELARVEPRGRVDLSRALEAVIGAADRPGMLVVLSDFLDAGPVSRSLSRAAAAGHDLVLVHVQSRDELWPTLEGDVTLVDAETGEEVTLVADAAVLSRYEASVAAHGRALHELGRRHRGTYVRAMSDEPLRDVVRRVVARSSDVWEAS